MQEKAALEGLDIDRLPSEPVPTWEETSEEARRKLHETNNQLRMIESRYWWTPPATAEDLRKRGYEVHRDLTPVELVEIDRLARTWEPAISGAVENYRIEWAGALEDLWSQQKFSKAPYFLPASDPSDEVRTLSSGGFAVNGWVIAYRVPASDYPTISSMRKELESLARERKAQVQEYLDSL